MKPEVGQVWQVFNRTEIHPAIVLDVGLERVKIVRLVPPNTKATPTFAQRRMFDHDLFEYMPGVGL